MIFILFISQSLNAQIKSKIALGGMFSKGNVNKQDYRGDLDFTKTDSAFEFSSLAKAAYSEENKVMSNREFRGNLRLDYLPFHRFSPFISVDGYNNYFKDISLRLSGIGGIKWSIYKKTDAKDKKLVYSNYSISAAIQYDVESYYSDKPKNELYRLSIRPKIRQKLVDNVFLDHVSFLKYKTSDWSDYQFESKTDLSTQITKKLQLQISYEYDFSSKPPQPKDLSREVLKEDQAFYVSLVYKIY